MLKVYIEIAVKIARIVMKAKLFLWKNIPLRGLLRKSNVFIVLNTIDMLSWMSFVMIMIEVKKMAHNFMRHLFNKRVLR